MPAIICYKKIFLFALLVILAGCSEKKFSIQKVGELRCRRSYAAIRFRDVPDKELDSIENSNPSCYSDHDTILITKLQKFGLLDKEYGLTRVMFKPSESKNFELAWGDRKIICQIARPADTKKYDVYNLVAIIGNKRSEIEIEGYYTALNEDIKYLLLDIIPGGFKEIVVLNEYYIMNGDNSDLFIYEIKQD
jgi:hypothetical protein